MQTGPSWYEACLLGKFRFCAAPMLPLSGSPGVQTDASTSESRRAALTLSLGAWLGPYSVFWVSSMAKASCI